MSNVNDWRFANILEQYKAREIDSLQAEVKKAENIMADPKYLWRDEEQKKVGQAKLSRMNERLSFLVRVYEMGKDLCVQHENLVNKLVKNYERWYNEVSNNGKQESEMMSSQADSLNEIFSEIYKELQPLKLEIKPPQALNLK